MRNILIVLPNDTLGGAEQVLKIIALNLKDSFVEIRFLKRKQVISWDLTSTQFDLVYENTSSEYVGALLFIFNLMLRPKKKYEYIFTSHVFVTGLVGILIKMGLLRKKYFVGRESTQIFERFSGFKLFLYKKMYQFGYNQLDLLICQTEQMIQSLFLNVPWLFDNIKIKVIPNPIDLKRITITTQVFRSPFVVGAGRLIPEKGFDILIEAFKEFVKKHKDYQLLILGEGKERAKLENQIKILKLENKVFLRGHVPNVFTYFKNASLCVVSSRIEGFPNVILQMMSQNDKVVSTNCAGDLDKIKGLFLAESFESKSLYQSMEKALETNTDSNNLLFEIFLSNRSAEVFVKTIEDELC
jgi:glycosyltransferase involved in cell wall biosynthesis